MLLRFWIQLLYWKSETFWSGKLPISIILKKESTGLSESNINSGWIKSWSPPRANQHTGTPRKSVSSATSQNVSKNIDGIKTRSIFFNISSNSFRWRWPYTIIYGLLYALSFLRKDQVPQICHIIFLSSEIDRSIHSIRISIPFSLSSLPIYAICTPLFFCIFLMCKDYPNKKK